MPTQPARRTAYQILGVHPFAPDELVNAAYWTATSELQQRRPVDESVDARLYAITRSYEMISNQESRAAYDASIGLNGTPIKVRPLSPMTQTLIGRILLRRPAVFHFDCYEVLGLDPEVPASRVPDAYRIMRDHYLRIPNMRRKQQLLAQLDEAYAVLSDGDRREKYNSQRSCKAVPVAQPIQMSPGQQRGRSKKFAERTRRTTSLRFWRRWIPVRRQAKQSPGGVDGDPQVTRSDAKPAGGVGIASVMEYMARGTATSMGHGFALLRKMCGLVITKVQGTTLRPTLRQKSTTRGGVDSPAPVVMPRALPKRPAEVEEALLGRLASRVDESEPAEGPDGHTSQRP